MRKERFGTTKWSLIDAARDRNDAVSRQALEELCEIYWPPIYTFIRYQGHDIEQSKDLTQEFFARVLEAGFFEAADPERGRFRTFLSVSLRNFLSDMSARDRAVKRGGNLYRIAMDVSDVEQYFAIDLSRQTDGESAFDRSWARSILDAAQSRLETEYRRKGKHGLFASLEPALRAPRGETSYAQLADSLGTTEGALRVAVRRLRKRYGEIIRELIKDTVVDSQSFDEEVRYLLALI